MGISLVSINPLNGSINVSPEIDIELILDGPLEKQSKQNVFLVGKGKEYFSGPFDKINYIPFDRTDLLKEPAYDNIVPVEYSIDYISTDSSGTSLGEDFKDYGTESYYSKLKLKPIKPLENLSQYTVYIVGTDTSATDFGLVERSIFDPLPDPGNSGNGVLLSKGLYSGVLDSTFSVEITESGMLGSAKYKWWKDSEPEETERISHFQYLQLKDGLSLRFSPEGTFAVGDLYTIVCKKPEYFAGIAYSVFTVGYVTQNPVLSTQTFLSEPAPPFDPSIVGQGNALSLRYMNPINYECNIDGNIAMVSFYFAKSIDGATIDTNGFRIKISSPTGDESVRASTNYIPNRIEISGNRLDVYLENT